MCTNDFTCPDLCDVEGTILTRVLGETFKKNIANLIDKKVESLDPDNNHMLVASQHADRAYLFQFCIL